jgi:hypothetical protein
MLELQRECDLLLEQLDRHRVGDSQDSAWIARSRERREAVGVLLSLDDQIRPRSRAPPAGPGGEHAQQRDARGGEYVLECLDLDPLRSVAHDIDDSMSVICAALMGLISIFRPPRR